MSVYFEGNNLDKELFLEIFMVLPITNVSCVSACVCVRDHSMTLITLAVGEH